MERIFYRVVRTDPPTRNDFLSQRDLGVPLRDPNDRELWEGVSVQATEQQARKRARLPGFGRFIAEIAVPDGGAIVWRRTGRQPGHHTLWANPDELLTRVTRVTSA